MTAPHDPGSNDDNAGTAFCPADLARAIVAGDGERVAEMLAAEPALASAVVNARSMLHHATDWPGHRPNVGATIGLLVRAGADPNATFLHPTSPGVAEQPLHWAASSNDIDAISALLAAGADIDAVGGIFGGCTPFEEAIIFEQFDAAKLLLLKRGALNYLPGAAALGRDDLIQDFFDPNGELRLDVGILPNWPGDTTRQTILDRAFQFACRSGHLAIARLLLDRGADAEAISPAGTSARYEAATHGHDDVVAWVDSLSGDTDDGPTAG